MDEKIIDLVRQHNVLYNQSLFEYRDQNVRQQAWEEIGRELKITADNAKATWEKLRRCFCNARNRRMSTKSGQATKKIAPWKFEQQMEFLLPYLGSRRRHGNSQNSETEYEILESFEVVNDDNDANEQEVEKRCADAEGTTDGGDVKHTTTTQQQTPPRDDILRAEKKRRKRSHSYRKAALRKRKIKETNIAHKNHISFESLDETDIFFLGLARMTKKLPKVEQASVKMIVSNEILQAELRSAQAHNDSTPTSQPLHSNRDPSTSSSSYSEQTLVSPDEYSRGSSETSNPLAGIAENE